MEDKCSTSVAASVYQFVVVVKTPSISGCEVGENPQEVFGVLVAKVGEVDAISSSR